MTGHVPGPTWGATATGARNVQSHFGAASPPVHGSDDLRAMVEAKAAHFDGGVAAGNAAPSASSGDLRAMIEAKAADKKAALKAQYDSIIAHKDGEIAALLAEREEVRAQLEKELAKADAEAAAAMAFVM